MSDLSILFKICLKQRLSMIHLQMQTFMPDSYNCPNILSNGSICKLLAKSIRYPKIVART